MHSRAQQDLFDYYNARAHEYDDIYYGKGPGIPHAQSYLHDTKMICKIAAHFGRGHVIDIGCGSGFWLPYYAGNCQRITLVDQSEKMLSMCKRRVRACALTDKCQFMNIDFLSAAWSDQFDGAVVGFFVSHIPEDEEQGFSEKLVTILKPSAQILFIDSAWSTQRAAYREKQGRQTRVLHNGRSFTVYKRYFTRSEAVEMVRRWKCSIRASYHGDVFCVIFGEKYE